MNWDNTIAGALKILAVLVLVMMNGFFVAAEFGMVKLRATRRHRHLRRHLFAEETGTRTPSRRPVYFRSRPERPLQRPAC